MMTETDTRQALTALLSRTDSALMREVITDLLDSDTPEQYARDTLQSGCSSGNVSALIYYTDTRAFYIKHLEEIDELIAQIETDTGAPLTPSSPRYNWCAWLAYEETARAVLGEIGIEV